MWLAALRHGLANLGNFAGRDRPGRFWPYAGTVLGCAMLVWSVYIGIMISDGFARMQAFAIAHPDQVTVTRGPGFYSMQVEGVHPELMPDMAGAIVFLAAIMSVLAVMLAAAVVRRLHDSQASGWIGLLPLVLSVSGFWLMHDLLGRLQSAKDPDFGRFFLLFGNNLVYLACLGWLIYLLIRAGTAGDNRYGPPPG